MAIDRSDRAKIRKLAKAFNEEIYETNELMDVFNRRFWFKVGNGVEYINHIDDLKKE